MRKQPEKCLQQLEPLESRLLFATYGSPWPDGARMSISFAPDATPITAIGSSLFSHLDASLARSEWQSDVLRAFQRWAIHANVNLAFVPDGGQPFGTPGLTLGDPRFGDVRIGAHAMGDEVLAISVPYDPARSGTFTGDVLLNTAFSFTGNPYDLTTIFLHEAGHIFGLDHSTDPASPMFERFNNPIGQLTPGDVASIRALYGLRADDPFDTAAANETQGDASPFPLPSTYSGSVPLALFADLTTSADVDYYRFTPPSGDDGYGLGGLTIRLQTAGLSLLTPSLSVLDSNGIVLATATSNSFTGDILSITLPTFEVDATYFIRVDSPAADEFSVGSYALAVTFDALNTATPAAIQQVLTGPHQNATADELAALFVNPSGTFLNVDFNNNDVLSNATDLIPSPGYSSGQHSQIVASISSPNDIDFYRLSLPAALVSNTVTITGFSADQRGLNPRITVTSETGQPVSTHVIANGNRTYTVQVLNVVPEQTLIIRLGGQSGTVGNYALTTDLSTPKVTLTTFVSGSVSTTPASFTTGSLYVAQTQLFHFLLDVSSISGSTSAALRLTLLNAQNISVWSLTARQGERVSTQSVLLKPGTYKLQASIVSTAQFRPAALNKPAQRIAHPQFISAPLQSTSVSLSDAFPSSSWPAQLESPLTRFSSTLIQPPSLVRATFALLGDSLSGPIGPRLADPTFSPTFIRPGQQGVYMFPNGTVTRNEFLFILASSRLIPRLA